MKNELEMLREEIAALRREIADLRANQTVHHYHHGPTPFHAPPAYVPPSSPWTTPWRPPMPVTCGGQAVGIGYSSQNRLC